MKLLLSMALVLPLLLESPLNSAADELLAEADSLYDQGGLERYKRAIDLYLKVLESAPSDYEANWKCARAHRQYGEEAKRQGVHDWEGICGRYGKEGMKYAQRAIEQRPDQPDGHYYYGLSVGIYSDGVSVVTAVRQGLKGKTQSLEKAYELDKMYDGAGPILALGRFWAVVPWPFRDRQKALRYYREFEATEYFVAKVQAKVYLAELLLELDGKGNRAEAKALLEQAKQSDEEYFRDWARNLLAEIK
jgi:hypothetical protein